MSLIFVRHGQSASNVGASLAGVGENAAIPLTEHGRAQAEALPDELPVPGAIYCSTFLRAQRTAQPYAQHHGRRAEVWAALNEFDYLPFDLVRREPRRALFRHDLAYWQRANPTERFGPESWADLQGRLDEFCARAATLPPASVCFGHSLWFKALGWRLAGQNPNDMAGFGLWQRSQRVPNGSIHTVSLTTGV